MNPLILISWASDWTVEFTDVRMVKKEILSHV